ncbi:hypothetical protein PybrP1_001101 [[Pythium] brassicae (nom. inval.)]|nr:hypothetical protein PybrP1_001101 [[Pythium] brassicae (nom. inval.)]
MPPINSIGLVLVGAGAVGRHLLTVVEEKFARLTVVAIADSRGVASDPHGLAWPQVRSLLTHKAKGGSVASWGASTKSEIIERVAAPDLLRLLERLHANPTFSHFVVVDCSASMHTAPALVRARQLGFAVVMANKLPLAAHAELYDQLVLTTDGRRSALVQYEATVGAGLPVVATLRRMVSSRDTIVSVQGSFSGTIGVVLAAMNRGSSFSAALGEAHAKGITEPDPRDDLSGLDVARKMVILAREMGLRAELSSVDIERLIPEALFTLSVPKFLASLPSLDAAFHQRWSDADSRSGARLAYLGTISASGELRVALEEVPSTSVFAHTASTEGAVKICSEWFPEPVVLRGTGAGVHSTVAALAADLALVMASW